MRYDGDSEVQERVIKRIRNVKEKIRENEKQPQIQSGDLKRKGIKRKRKILIQIVDDVCIFAFFRTNKQKYFVFIN